MAADRRANSESVEPARTEAFEREGTVFKYVESSSDGEQNRQRRDLESDQSDLPDGVVRASILQLP